ncbi:hypothetical protein Pcinc_032790 [Petrolisthes cinctipes]|uniref:Sodium/potassium-transporting ATPase subunit beta n=1 Tax=Petrolisthes cinctipes TaxID=88211 RepID=A0AAE1ETT8_PETCI|nr:hypothetical protein Pcinc_032790 [Petrolisthes cinctipes]
MVTSRKKGSFSPPPPPPSTSRVPQGKQSFKTFLWNSKTNEFLGRTGISWAKIGLFYVVFYLFLAGVFSLLMKVFLNTIDDKLPTYNNQQDSLLKNPGLSFRPRTDIYHQRQNYIAFYPDHPNTYTRLFKDTNEFLKQYQKALEEPELYSNCTDRRNRDDVTKPCMFNLTNALMSLNNTCTEDNQWGYSTNSPCIFFKLNKMINFIPTPPQDIPEGVRNKLNVTGDLEENQLTENVLVWCESEDDGVSLEQPSPFLPLYFFPYLNQPHYLSPLVVVRINAIENQDFVVKCKAYGENIPGTANGRKTGIAHFLIRVVREEA